MSCLGTEKSCGSQGITCPVGQVAWKSLSCVDFAQYCYSLNRGQRSMMSFQTCKCLTDKELRIGA